jgi:hypothetical protein
MAKPKRRTRVEQFYFVGAPIPAETTELCTIDKMPMPKRIAADPDRLALWNFICADMENRRCLSSTYTLLISELVEVCSLMYKCREAIDKDGEIVEKFDDEGNYLASYPNPFVTILTRQQPVLIKLLEKIGMSPRDIHYLVNPEATALSPIETTANDMKAITYFR